MSGRDADLILVGGGLASGLLALRLTMLRPELSLLVLEAGPTLGGNHTWCFHAGDLTPAEAEWIAPLVAHRWSGHEVRFPGTRRRLRGGYAAITAGRFHQVLAESLGPERLRLGAPVAAVEPTRVELASGESLAAGAVVDGRGPVPSPHLWLGFQSFLGLELQLSASHGLLAPILMDATVEQQGGYRFLYTLPFAPDRLLVEDTSYADGPGLDRDRLRERVLAYAEAQGWGVDNVVREEEGVLPIILGGDVQKLWRETRGVPCVGLRAGLFHATTGYSLPEAVRLADHVAHLPDLSAGTLHAAVETYAQKLWRRQGFERLLNRMLFLAAGPGERRAVMARFYGLPESLIERFYAGRLTPLDRVRLLSGRPPVPLLAAARAALAHPPRET